MSALAAIDAPRLPAGLLRALHPLEARLPAHPWNMDAIHELLPSGTALTPAAVLIGLQPVAGAGWQLLLTVRHAGLRNHAGQVSFPGGRIDPDDAGVVAAALREAEEEIGLPRRQASPLGLLDPLATITGFSVVPVVATIAADFVPRAQPGEVDEVFGVPLDFVLRPDTLRRDTVRVRGVRHEILRFDDRGEPRRMIWGVSASILHNLRERIEGLA